MRSVALAVMLAGCAGVGLTAAGCAGISPGFALAPDAEDEQLSELTEQTLGVPGEAMEYSVALRGVTVGNVVVSVGEAGVVDGHRAVIIKSRAASTGFAALFGDARWELTTTLDMDTGLPLHEIEEMWVELKGKSPKHRRDERDWTERGYNLHAAAGALRGWKSRAGQHASLDVTFDHFAIDVDVWEAARDYLPSAKQPAMRYDGVAIDRTFSVWLSDDEARVPLLLRRETKLGLATVELVRYDPPADDR